MQIANLHFAICILQSQQLGMCSMSLPVRHLPVLQNWDCHVCGSCCKEYLVTVTDEERRRLEAQGWETDPEIGDLPLFSKSGPWWARRYHLTHRSDGSCIFLTEQGRCRI